jgi:hypothetical protein
MSIGSLYSPEYLKMKCFPSFRVLLPMDREARLVLEAAVADLREINQKLERMLPETNGDTRENLLEIQNQSVAAIRYYTYVLSRTARQNTPAIADRVGQAAFGANCVGLVPPSFSVPSGTP